MSKKPLVTMMDWQLYVYDEKYSISGTVDNHPKIGRNAYIWKTSPMETYTFESDVLTYETQNTIYVCPLKYMSLRPYGNVIESYKKKLMYRADDSDDILDRIIAASARLANEEDLEDAFVVHIKTLQGTGQQELKEREEQENQRLIEIVKQYENAVYIEVTCVNQGDKLAYHLGDALGTLTPYVHSGMFQDSILYTQYDFEGDGAELDFRYFPKQSEKESSIKQSKKQSKFKIVTGNCDIMESYSWSDNIDYVVIKNDTKEPLTFNRELIAVDETKVFTPKGHVQGLISPDCYNGKSILNPHPE